MTAIADVTLETARELLGRENRSTFNVALGLVPPEDRDEIIERAAIMEVDGGLQRPKAEELALRSWVVEDQKESK
jgi:hypothetical protein